MSVAVQQKREGDEEIIDSYREAVDNGVGFLLLVLASFFLEDVLLQNMHEAIGYSPIDKHAVCESESVIRIVSGIELVDECVCFPVEFLG